MPNHRFKKKGKIYKGEKLLAHISDITVPPETKNIFVENFIFITETLMNHKCDVETSELMKLLWQILSEQDYQCTAVINRVLKCTFDVLYASDIISDLDFVPEIDDMECFLRGANETGFLISGKHRFVEYVASLQNWKIQFVYDFILDHGMPGVEDEDKEYLDECWNIFLSHFRNTKAILRFGLNVTEDTTAVCEDVIGCTPMSVHGLCDLVISSLIFTYLMSTDFDFFVVNRDHFVEHIRLISRATGPLPSSYIKSRCLANNIDYTLIMEAYEMIKPHVPELPEIIGDRVPALQHICRCMIRQHLYKNWALPNGIYKLNLPNTIQEYLDLGLKIV